MCGEHMIKLGAFQDFCVSNPFAGEAVFKVLKAQLTELVFVLFDMGR